MNCDTSKLALARWLPSTLFAIVVAAAMAVAPGQARAQAAPVATSFSVEILALPAARTMRDGQAVPGWDAEPLMAIKFSPASGDNMYGPAFVIVDEGPGENPTRLSQATRFAGERLAAKGYTVLSIFSRIERGYGNIPFENSALDVKAAIDFLEARGHEDIVLAGHGFGSVVISHYLAGDVDGSLDSPGNNRVKAAVHFAPATDALLSEGGFANQQELDAAVKKATVALAAPRGQVADGERPPAPATIVHGGFMQSPQAFLSYFGPSAKTRTSVLFRELKVPLLLLASRNDPTVPAGRLEALKSTAIASPRVDTIWYDRGNHAFEDIYEQAIDDVTAWLGSQGLGVRQRVKVEIIDARMDNGVRLPGVLYTPADGEYRSKLAFVLQFGTSGDILHSATNWLAWRLAQAGHAVLAPQSRMSGSWGLENSTYAEQTADLAKWMDVLESRGIKRVAMEGHSLGGVLISNYKERTGDPRVVGMIYMAPTRDSPTRARQGAGEKAYAAVVKEARAAVKRGDGNSVEVRYPTNPTLSRDNLNGRPPRLGWDGGLAAHFLDFRGPNAPLHTEVVKKIDVPSLTFAGTADGLMTKEFVDQFTAAYRGKAEVVWIKNGAHNGRDFKNLYRDEILAWARRNGL